MFFKQIVAIALVFFISYQAASKEVCHVQTNELSVEFVLLQDFSGSYRDFIPRLRAVVPKLVAALQKNYPEVRMGLAGFSDWRSRTGNSADECYVAFHPISTDINALSNKMSQIRIGWGFDLPESSLTGLKLAATDPNLRWAQGDRSPEGRRIIRVIALATDDLSLTAAQFRQRHSSASGSAGRGGAECENRVHTAKEVGQVLKQRDIYFIGLISGKRNVQDAWRHYLKEMDVPGVVSTLDIKRPEDLINVLEKSIETVVCVTEGEATTTAPEPTTPFTEPAVDQPTEPMPVETTRRS